MCVEKRLLTQAVVKKSCRLIFIAHENVAAASAAPAEGHQHTAFVIDHKNTEGGAHCLQLFEQSWLPSWSTHSAADLHFLLSAWVMTGCTRQQPRAPSALLTEAEQSIRKTLPAMPRGL